MAPTRPKTRQSAGQRADEPTMVSGPTKKCGIPKQPSRACHGQHSPAKRSAVGRNPTKSPQIRTQPSRGCKRQCNNSSKTSKYPKRDSHGTVLTSVEYVADEQHDTAVAAPGFWREGNCWRFQVWLKDLDDRASSCGLDMLEHVTHTLYWVRQLAADLQHCGTRHYNPPEVLPILYRAQFYWDEVQRVKLMRAAECPTDGNRQDSPHGLLVDTRISMIDSWVMQVADRILRVIAVKVVESWTSYGPVDRFTNELNQNYPFRGLMEAALLPYTRRRQSGFVKTA